MTKDEYIAWKQTRGPDAGAWDREACYAADALIRQTALANFAAYVETTGWTPALKDFMLRVVPAHFGSVEVDNLLTELKMYPDWM